MVQTPLTRIQGTFDIYSKTFKEALSQHRQTLTAHQVTLEDNEAIQTEISKMEVALEKARTENNEKKVQGIEKAIVGAQNRLANPKKAPLLNKIFGDFDSVMRLQKDLLLSNSAIEKAQSSEKEVLQGPLSTVERRAKTQEIKTERERLERVFKDKLAVMDRRFREFQERLPALIALALSPEQVKAILEKMKAGSGEKLDHYETDVVTLGNILNVDNTKDKFEGRSMSIELWSRDPDVDLYLGNYTSCCVSIDNDYHGGESPIADYLTDIGMQVVTITDQKRKRPVVAAWCYIGTDNDKNVALVIDNIEADTNYSVPFKKQLEDKLRAYVEEYAKVSGIKIISQGPYNNDLVVSTLEERYEKLGGYNRKDGYYLEGEPD